MTNDTANDRPILTACRGLKKAKSTAQSESSSDDLAMEVEHVECAMSREELSENNLDHISKLSLEILCRIMKSLSLFDVIKMEHLSRRLHQAVSMHLRLLTDLDFIEGNIYGWMPETFTDKTLGKFLPR